MPDLGLNSNGEWMMAAKIRAVTNNKGGTGKSTSCIQLADLVARANPSVPVLIVDLDPQSHVAKFLGLQDTVQGMCIGNVLKNPAELRSNIVNAGTDNYQRKNLFVIPSSRRLERTLDELMALSIVGSRHGDGINMETVLADALESIVGGFGYIFIDCPPNLGSLTTAVYNFAQEVIVPTATKAVDFDGAQEHTDHLYGLRNRLPNVINAKLLMVIPTMYDSRTRQAGRVLSAMKSVYGEMTVTSPVPDRVEVKEAPENGMTLYEYTRAIGKESTPLSVYASIAGRLV